MKTKILYPFIGLTFLIFGYGNGQEVKKLTGPDVFPPVYGIVEVPETEGLHPSVLILHGADGWSPAYATMAKAMSEAGYLALTIDWFAGAKAPLNETDLKRRFSFWPQYQETVRNAVTFLRSHPSSKRQPVGIIGVSMGAHLAISVGNQIPGIYAVVDFFGAGGFGGSLESQVTNFPPLLILHGEADTAVPVINAYDLQEAVIADGGEVEMYIYPNAHHAFIAPFLPDYSESAANDAFMHAGLFLNKWLKGADNGMGN